MAAVSGVSKRHVASHATSAVVLKVDAYRRILDDGPTGFLPAVEDIDLDRRPARWRGLDTGDRITQAMIEAGHEVQRLHLDDGDEIAVFNHISFSRRIAEWLTGRAPARIFGNEVFWEGYATTWSCGSCMIGSSRSALPIVSRSAATSRWRH